MRRQIMLWILVCMDRFFMDGRKLRKQYLVEWLHGSRAMEFLKISVSRGLNLSRCIIGHSEDNPHSFCAEFYDD